MISVELDEQGTIGVVGAVDVQHAARLHEGLTRVLQDRTEGLVLDLGGITAIDTAGAQVLIAFKRAVPSLSVHSCPLALRERLDRMSLLTLLV